MSEDNNNNNHYSLSGDNVSNNNNNDNCVCCSRIILIEVLSFEQRLVGDKDFCHVCWNEIMTFLSDEDLSTVLDAFADSNKRTSKK